MVICLISCTISMCFFHGQVAAGIQEFTQKWMFDVYTLQLLPS